MTANPRSVLAIAALGAAAWAQEPPGPDPETTFTAPGSGHYTLRFHYAKRSDGPGHGNPYHDEDLTVYEPGLAFDYQLTARTQLWGRLTYDEVKNAQIDDQAGLSSFSDAWSDDALGGELGFDHRSWPHTTLGAWLGGGADFVVRTVHAGAHVVHRFADAESVLARLQLSAERLQDGFGNRDERQGIDLALAYRRPVGASSRVEVGLGLLHESGALETPYYTVADEWPAYPPNPRLENRARAIAIPERLPDERNRFALHVGIGNEARSGPRWGVRGQVDGDDWSRSSVTVEPRAGYGFADGTVRVAAHYRLILQDGSRYHRGFYSRTRRSTYHTQDPEYDGYTLHAVGLRLDWEVSPGNTVQLAGEYAERNDGIEARFATVAFRHAF